jgi:hypothetical protein
LQLAQIAALFVAQPAPVAAAPFEQVQALASHAVFESVKPGLHTMHAVELVHALHPAKKTIA